MDIVKNHNKVFAHELKVTWCASAGVQMALAILGLGDNSNAFQREIQGRVHEWESQADSHNGDWGPSAMALALKAYGAQGLPGARLPDPPGRPARRGEGHPEDALAGPAARLARRPHLGHDRLPRRRRPVGLRGREDPGHLHPRPVVPDVSSIWGPSDPPGTYQNDAEMVRNYLKWKRPEGLYPSRDGLYIAVVPTVVKTAS